MIKTSRFSASKGRNEYVATERTQQSARPFRRPRIDPTGMRTGGGRHPHRQLHLRSQDLQDGRRLRAADQMSDLGRIKGRHMMRLPAPCSLPATRQVPGFCAPAGPRCLANGGIRGAEHAQRTVFPNPGMDHPLGFLGEAATPLPALVFRQSLGCAAIRQHADVFMAMPRG